MPSGITKTGIRVVEHNSGNIPTVFEVSGEASSINATGLPGNTQYDVEAYVEWAGQTVNSTNSDTFTTLITGTATFTDVSSAWSTSLRQYDLNYSVTSTYYIQTISVMWANNSSYTGATSASVTVTPNQTTHSIIKSLTSGIPNYGNRMYVKITVINIYNETFIEEFSTVVPAQSFTVYSSYVDSGNDYIFTASTQPVNPTYAIYNNEVECKDVDSGDTYTGSSMGLSSVTITLPPAEYTVVHYVTDIYGQTDKIEYINNIKAFAPLIKNITVEADTVEFDLIFFTGMSYNYVELAIDDGGGEQRFAIDPDDPSTWKISGIQSGDYTAYVEVDDGTTYKSSLKTFTIE